MFLSDSFGFIHDEYTYQPKLLYQVDISTSNKAGCLLSKQLILTNLKDNDSLDYTIVPYEKEERKGVLIYSKEALPLMDSEQIGQLCMGVDEDIDCMHFYYKDSLFSNMSIIDPTRFELYYKINDSNKPLTNFKIKLEDQDNINYYAITLWGKKVVLGKVKSDTVHFHNVFADEKLIVVAVENNFNEKVKWCIQELDASKGSATVRLKHTSFNKFLEAYRKLVSDLETPPYKPTTKNKRKDKQE